MLKRETSAGEGTKPHGHRTDAERSCASDLGTRCRNVPSNPSRREFLIGAGASIAILVLGIPQAGAKTSPALKVGLILPEGGPSSDEAKSLAAGFDLFWKENGSPVPEILRKDSGPNDEATLEALTDLAVNNEVRFLIGPPTPAGSEKIVHGLTAGKAILFVTNPCVRLVAGEMCTSASFRLCPNTWQSSQPLAAWALKSLGRRVFITGLDDPQGNEEADFFAYGFDRAGGSFGDRVMAASKEADMAAVLSAAAKAKPDFVFASFRQQSAREFLKAWSGASLPKQVPVIGPGGLTAFPHTLQELGSSCAGVKTLTTMKKPAEFEDRLKKQLGREVPYVCRAAEGYDIGQVIARVMKEGAVGTGDVSEIAGFIEGIDITGPRGKIRFDKNHEPILDVMIQEWEPSGNTFSQKVVKDLGSCSSPDFGCGKVGFPRRPGPEIKDEEPVWVDESE